MSVYNRDYNVIFIHVPKTAGTSMERQHFLGGGGHQPITDYMHLPGFTTAFKFAFVRNPWDRFLSAYRHVVGGTDEDFTRYVAALDRVPGGVHFQPQHEFVCDPSGKVPLSFLGRYERLEEDWSAVCGFVGAGDVPLPHCRRSDGADYDTCYDEASRQAIARLYAKDIDLFQYQFAGREGA